MSNIWEHRFLPQLQRLRDHNIEGWKGGGGGLNHESREINEVFHDSHKFFEGFTFHVKSVQDAMTVCH